MTDLALPLVPLVVLYAAFATKQFVADYVFQTDAIAAGKSAPSGWVTPLGMHAGMHGFGTLVIVLIAAPGLWWLALVDALVHATIDRTKGRFTAKRGLTPANDSFWVLFGADQMAHQLTHFALIVTILLARG